jgi:hypothetical protein
MQGRRERRSGNQKNAVKVGQVNNLQTGWIGTISKKARITGVPDGGYPDGLCVPFIAKSVIRLIYVYLYIYICIYVYT